MKEQQIQLKIQKFLEQQGCYVVKVIAANRAGVPDLLVCYKGKFIGVEVKTPKTQNNISKLQEYNLEKIQRSQGISLVATCVEDLEFLFQ